MAGWGASWLTLKGLHERRLLTSEKRCTAVINLYQNECPLTLSLVLRLPLGLNFSGTPFALLYKS